MSGGGAQSTIWAALALPLSPVGDIPFVGTDKVTITTASPDFRYEAVLAILNVFGGLKQGYFSLVANTTGTVTVNAPSGRVTVPAGASICIVNCPYVLGTNSIVLLQLETVDATLIRVRPTNIVEGQFIVSGNAVSTGNCTVSFVVSNTATTETPTS